MFPQTNPEKTHRKWLISQESVKFCRGELSQSCPGFSSQVVYYRHCGRCSTQRQGVLHGFSQFSKRKLRITLQQTQRGKSSIQFDDFSNFSSWPCCILGDFQAMFLIKCLLFLNTRYNLDDPWRMVRTWLDIDLFYRYIRIPLGPSNLAESSQRSVIKPRYRKRVQSQILIGIGPEEIADLGHMNGS